MDWDKIIALLSLHWPFLAVAFILGIVGEVIKGIVLGSGDEQIVHGKYAKWYKKTLPLHPIVSGAILGLVLSTTIPDIVMSGGVISSVLYFAVSGAISSTFYNLLKLLYPHFVSALRRWIAKLFGRDAKLSSKAKEQPEEPEEP